MNKHNCKIGDIVFKVTKRISENVPMKDRNDIQLVIEEILAFTFTNYAVDHKLVKFCIKKYNEYKRIGDNFDFRVMDRVLYALSKSDYINWIKLKDCKYGVNCKRKNDKENQCIFNHDIQVSYCRYGMKCRGIGKERKPCLQNHIPINCLKGDTCQRDNCIFDHPRDVVDLPIPLFVGDDLPITQTEVMPTEPIQSITQTEVMPTQAELIQPTESIQPIETIISSPILQSVDENNSNADERLEKSISDILYSSCDNICCPFGSSCFNQFKKDKERCKMLHCKDAYILCNNIEKCTDKCRYFHSLTDVNGHTIYKTYGCSHEKCTGCSYYNNPIPKEKYNEVLLKDPELCLLRSNTLFLCRGECCPHECKITRVPFISEDGVIHGCKFSILS
jgi:hypothetical protein